MSLPLLLFIIHAVGAHRNPGHGALILFVLAEQIHPKRQVTVLKKHFIFSLNRLDSQRVGEEMTRWNGLPTVTPLTTDLLRTSRRPLSMGMVQSGTALPAPRAQSFDSITLPHTEPWVPLPGFCTGALQRSWGFRSSWSLCWHSCGSAAQVHPERCSAPPAGLHVTQKPCGNPSWDPPRSCCYCCKFAWTVPKMHLFMPVSVT